MKYVHTNLITDDWKRLAGFYVQVFGCKLVLPQRHLSGEWLSKGTGVDNAHIHGAHLRLPGYGPNGPTLEIFQYTNNISRPKPLSNEKGLGHLAFEVDDVTAILEKVLAFGGKHYGEIVQHDVPAVGRLTFVYARDPDGNIIELQNWDRSEQGTDPMPIEIVVQDQPQASKTPASPPSVESPSDDWDEDAPLDKRAYLNNLNNDLDQTRRDTDLTKAEIRALKEEARHQKNQIKRSLKYDPDQPLDIKKTKQELVEELKNEGKSEVPKVEPSQKTPPSSEPTLLSLPQTPASLTVELRLANDSTQTLKLTALELGIAPEILAEHLRAFVTVGHPDQPEYSFLQRLGKQYRADLVPLVKHYRLDDAVSVQKEAWILVPRLRGSLGHLNSQFKAQPKVLEDSGVERLGLVPNDIIKAYTALLAVVAAAEEQEAEYLRLSYSA